MEGRRKRGSRYRAKRGGVIRHFVPHPSRCSGPPFRRSPTLRVVVRVGVANVMTFERNLRQDVATDGVRKASLARAPDSPMSAEHKDV